MLYINRDNLNSNNDESAILEVVDEAISNYIKTLSNKGSFELETITDDLPSIDSLLFKSFIPNNKNKNYFLLRQQCGLSGRI